MDIVLSRSMPYEAAIVFPKFLTVSKLHGGEKLGAAP
jgi:hypothetical protein